jgi:DNA-binding NtrC family response regulator
MARRQLPSTAMGLANASSMAAFRHRTNPPIAKSNMPVRILIVEEDKPAREAFGRLASALGHECVPVESVGQALEVLAAEVFGLCVVSPGLSAEDLRNLLATAESRGVTVCDLPASMKTDLCSLGPALVDLPPQGVDLRLLLTQLENRLIGQALERTGGNKNRAASLLGLNRTTLVEKLRRRSVA